nr:FAD-binding oxidoreductase [Halomonas tianxiuensis]
MGGRGPFHEPRGEPDFRHLQRAIGKLYPALKNVEIGYRWAGRVALTRDALPTCISPQRG